MAKIMKKKIVVLLLLAFAFITVNANTLAKHKVQLETWKSSTRAPVPIPIDAFIEENSSILIKFFERQSQPVTFQIKDNHGNIIFQDMVTPSEEENYTIDLNEFKQGEYELFYLDGHTMISGRFYIE
jgi:hypothetical protein